MKRWYVAHTQVYGESKAEDHLRAQGFSVYIPRIKTLRRHARKVETILAPLFPRYIFVGFDVEQDRWKAIDSTRGVSYLLRHEEKPLSVPTGVVEELQEQEDEQEGLSLSSLALFKRGERVEVLDGVFTGHVGVFEEMTTHARVQLLLSCLGREVKVALPIHTIKAA